MKFDYTVKSWDEDRSITTVPRVTPAHVVIDIGDGSAISTLDFIMTYVDGSAEFVYTATIEAADLDGKKGSFITQGSGSHSTSTGVDSTFDIVKGSGQGDFESASGKGKMLWLPSAAKGEYTFDISI